MNGKLKIQNGITRMYAHRFGNVLIAGLVCATVFSLADREVYGQLSFYGVSHRPAPTSGPGYGPFPAECPIPLSHYDLQPLNVLTESQPLSPQTHRVMKPVFAQEADKPEDDLPNRQLVNENSPPQWLEAGLTVIDRENFEEFAHGFHEIPNEFIVASSRWATTQEAVAEVDLYLAQLMTQKIQSQLVSPASSEKLQSLLEHIEPYFDRTKLHEEQHRLELSDGTEAEMVRVYQKISVHPLAMQSLGRELRQLTVQSRLVQTGGAIGAFSLLCGAASLLLWRKKTTT